MGVKTTNLVRTEELWSTAQAAWPWLIQGKYFVRCGGVQLDSKWLDALIQETQRKCSLVLSIIFLSYSVQYERRYCIWINLNHLSVVVLMGLKTYLINRSRDKNYDVMLENTVYWRQGSQQLFVKNPEIQLGVWGRPSSYRHQPWKRFSKEST